MPTLPPRPPGRWLAGTKRCCSKQDKLCIKRINKRPRRSLGGVFCIDGVAAYHSTTTRSVVEAWLAACTVSR